MRKYDVSQASVLLSALDRYGEYYLDDHYPGSAKINLYGMAVRDRGLRLGKGPNHGPNA